MSLQTLPAPSHGDRRDLSVSLSEGQATGFTFRIAIESKNLGMLEWGKALESD